MSLNDKLDVLRPKEEAFRAESKHRRMANGVLRSFTRTVDEERIEELGWPEHPNEDRPVHPEVL